MDPELLRFRVEICKAMANANRLKVIDQLKGGEKAAAELSRLLELSSAKLSKDMSVLQSAGIVESRREGKSVFYSLSDPRILQACELMFDVLWDRLRHWERLSRSAQ
jgi:ArsR family transcriptional regulator